MTREGALEASLEVWQRRGSGKRVGRRHAQPRIETQQDRERGLRVLGGDPTPNHLELPIRRRPLRSG